MYCDHEPLVKAFYSSTQRENARECRHLSEMASLCTNLKYIKECDNVVVDALSHVEIAAIFQHAAQIDWNDFAKAQQNDYVLKRYLEGTNSVNVLTQEWRVSNCFVTFHVMVCRVRWFLADFGVSFSTIATT